MGPGDLWEGLVVTQALIPANALSWFQSLPSDYSGRRETVVYAQVE